MERSCSLARRRAILARRRARLSKTSRPRSVLRLESQTRIRILIAEDHLIARAGLGAIVNAQPDMAVVAEAENGEQARDMYARHRPDVTLMDMRMPVMDGVEAITAIRADFPGARIVALSTFGGDEDIRRALVAGARAYLTKDVLHDDLIGAIREVYAGRQYLPASVRATLAAESPHPDLSGREMEVLRLIVWGMSNKPTTENQNLSLHDAHHNKKT